LLGDALFRLRKVGQRCADEQRPNELLPVGQSGHRPHPRAGVNKSGAISNPEMWRVRS
jgi:hypothetical protein